MVSNTEASGPSSFPMDAGFSLSEKLKGKVLKSGKRQCNYECKKQGKSSTFVVPARNF